MSLLHALLDHPSFARRESDYIRWYPKSLTPVNPAALALPAKPQGIYVHVPFCDQLCRFCPFNKRQTDRQDVAAYVSALIREIELYAALSDGPPLEFIYFGGGTPSVLSAPMLQSIISAIQRHFALAPNVEISAECHPTHLVYDWVRAAHDIGINRISSGIQSFDDTTLATLGAQHTAEQGLRAIETVGNVFGSIAIDLLFRSAGQTLEHWASQVERTLSIGCIDHISMYSLIAKDPDTLPPPEMEAEMTVLAYQRFVGAGFEHYASCASGGFDFARTGRRCTYEARHWGAPQAEFLGLGPGALGFAGGHTTVNGLGLSRYVNELGVGSLPLVSATQANADELRRRYFVLGVKTLDVPLAPFEQQFGDDPCVYFAREFAMLLELGFATISNTYLLLTPLGRLFVDSVSAVFFSDTERAVPHPEEPEIRRAEVAATKRRQQAIATAHG